MALSVSGHQSKEDFDPDKKGEIFEDEQISNRLLDFTIVALFFVVFIAWLFAQLRALDIGWSVRDFVQTSLMTALTFIYFSRHKLSSRVKAISFITVLTAAAFSGVYSFSFFAPSMMLLPVATTVCALIFPRQTTFSFLCLSFGIFTLVIALFYFEVLEFSTPVETLSTIPAHLVTYLSVLAILLFVVSNSILFYRKQIHELINTIHAKDEEIKELSELLPICSYCRKLKDDDGNWYQLETYLNKNTSSLVTHGLCPECKEIHFDPFIRKK